MNIDDFSNADMKRIYELRAGSHPNLPDELALWCAANPTTPRDVKAWVDMEKAIDRQPVKETDHGRERGHSESFERRAGEA